MPPHLRTSGITQHTQGPFLGRAARTRPISAERGRGQTRPKSAGVGQLAQKGGAQSSRGGRGRSPPADAAWMWEGHATHPPPCHVAGRSGVLGGNCNSTASRPIEKGLPEPAWKHPSGTAGRSCNCNGARRPVDTQVGTAYVGWFGVVSGLRSVLDDAVVRLSGGRADVPLIGLDGTALLRLR